MAETDVVRIDEIAPRGVNPSTGTERGGELLRRSLQAFGPGRSIVLDKNLTVINGEKILDAAAAVGVDNVVLVHTRGDQLVAVVRDDLDGDIDPRAAGLALVDGRVGELNLRWDPQSVKALCEALKAAGIDPSLFWGAEEFAAVTSDDEDEQAEVDEEPKEDKYKVLSFRVKKNDAPIIEQQIDRIREITGCRKGKALTVIAILLAGVLPEQIEVAGKPREEVIVG